MRLKSLTLSGFKSFPKRTIIHFPTGISAIVGPNGCGKSNIIDAIRWVLGEQSPKMLRAKQMSDLIFRGSSGAKAPASAYVKLVLENTGRLMPPELEDLPEIEIERILFANGDAKYRLNRKNCRLKEIRYLFMDTGAGTRAYSIIDQGQVNEFVEMSPDERRFMVEEVAGISRYKARRSEARRQMEETSLNLERLEDIIHEVERQMRSLKRQAGKARRYMALEEEKKGLEQGILAHRWQEVKDRAEETAARISEVEQEMDLLLAEEAALKLSVRKTAMELESDRARLQEAKSRLRRLQEELRTVEEEIQLLERTRVDLRSRMEGAARRLRETDELEEQLSRRIHDASSETDSLEKRICQLEEQAERASYELQQSRQAHEEALKQAEQAKGRLMDEISRRARIESEISRLEDRLFHLEDKVERHRAKQKELEALHEKISEEQEQERLRLAALTEEEASISSEMEGLRRKKAAIAQDLQEIRSRIAAHKEELAGIQVRLSTLKALERAGAGLSQGEKAILASEKGKGLSPLAASLKVEPGWEAVVETALGSLARSLVIEDMEQAAALAEVVRRAGRGSAGLLIKSLAAAVEPPGPYRIPSEEAARSEIRILADVVEACSKEAAAALCRLSSCIYVEDLDQARALYEQLRPITDRPFLIVTRRLEVLSSDGCLKVHTKKGEEEGIIFRQAELQRLADKEKEISRLLETLTDEEGGLSRQISGIDSMLDEKAVKLKEIEKKKQALNHRLSAIALEMDKAANRLELMEFEAHEAEAEMEMARSRLEELKEELEGRKEKEAGLRQEVEALDRHTSELSSRMEERRSALEAIRMDLARARAALDERQRTAKALIKDLSALKERRQALLKEQAGLKEELSRCDSSLEQAKGRFQSLKERLKAASLDIRAKEEAAENKEEGFRAAEAQLRDLRHRISLVRERRLNLEAKAQELASALSSIEEELNARFGKGPKELAGAGLLGEMDRQEAMERLAEIKARMEKMGSVNLAAIEDYEKLAERHGYLMEQKEDLLGSLNDVQQAIERIDRECTEKFKKALSDINGSLEKIFPLLFDGGSAKLTATGEGDIWETGIDYQIRLPGKQIQHLALLSGGEKALSALALIFAIFFIKPSPFCLLDEVDAPLDEANTERFNRLVKKIAVNSQVLLVTHNQRVMEIADTLYGVTMEEKGISKLVSVNLVELA